MNCCDDYGQCKQGQGCPCRPSYAPEALRAAQDKYQVIIDCDCGFDWLTLCIYVALAFALAAVVGGNLGYWMCQ